MIKELPKVYDPHEVEDRVYKSWIDGNYFHAVPEPGKKPFTIVIPPPNVTAQLHMGHALDNTLQDILIRFRRMQGYCTLWVPGTDHAGIATQIKVEEDIRLGEGKSRHDLGREEFLKRVWNWKEKYGSRIIAQLKKLGASCDWERERFTMDDGLSRAVRAAFVSLYDKGLIYRGHRIINWCPDCETALSDAEVDYEEQEGFLWYVRYPVKGGGEIVIATTRPETMLGDTGIAVNPGDERYGALIGKTAVLPLVGREIPIFGDEYVDAEFGTGCVKVTPCHDPNDFEMGQRHGLEQVLIMDEKGRINKNGGEFAGMDRYEARDAVVKALERDGLLVKVEKHMHSVGQCYRCGTTVEPITSDQWFVSMKPLAGPAIDVVKTGEVKFVPDRFSKIYLNWMENVRDWCISRQLWWGHRIPAFYCRDCGHMQVSMDDVKTCEKCGSGSIRQDDDVLDTWFSSALWPFSTLGWPDDTPELRFFYPTSVLVTSYDIIFFWVARMIFSGLEHMGERPFDTVFIHGLLRDSEGRKMSKSLGNGIDPLELIDGYGADALRFMLVTGNAPGNDMRFYTEKLENARNFANKIWNAARFVMMNLGEGTRNRVPQRLETEDRWIISLYNTLVQEVTTNLERFELGVALQKLYDFIWDNLCDWYIELVKYRLTGDDAETKAAAQDTLCFVLSGAMTLLHPFMPFVTEEIWSSLPQEGASVMVTDWPVYDEALRFEQDEADMERLMAAIKAIRLRRAEMNVPPSKKASVYIETAMPDKFAAGKHFFTRLAGAASVEIGPGFDIEGAVSIVTEGALIKIPFMELVDVKKELERLEKERAAISKELERLEAKLANPGFLSKAPPELVKAEREKQKAFTDMLDKTRAGIAELS